MRHARGPAARRWDRIARLLEFDYVLYTRMRVAASRAGLSIAEWIRGAIAAALNSQLTETPMQPDLKTPAGEAAEKATMLRATNPDPGTPDATQVDPLAKRQPCAGRPASFAPPKSATN